MQLQLQHSWAAILLIDSFAEMPGLVWQRLRLVEICSQWRTRHGGLCRLAKVSYTSTTAVLKCMAYMQLRG